MIQVILHKNLATTRYLRRQHNHADFLDKTLCLDAASIGSFLGFVTEQKKLAGILKLKQLM